MIYLAYLDEFGHIGPFLSHHDARYKTSPVFGLAGFLLPADEVRSFTTWFFQRKCNLLDYEIRRSGKHPAQWEKKGSALYTLRNIEKYPELHRMTHRLLNRIGRAGGHVFFTGLEKPWGPEELDSRELYRLVLRETLKRLDDYCRVDHGGNASIMIVLDEHEERLSLVAHAAVNMFGGEEPRRHIIEPPFQVESHMYQSLQAADWLAGLVGRIGCIWARPEEYADFLPFRRFERHLCKTAIRSRIKTLPKR